MALPLSVGEPLLDGRESSGERGRNLLRRVPLGAQLQGPRPPPAKLSDFAGVAAELPPGRARVAGDLKGAAALLARPRILVAVNAQGELEPQGTEQAPGDVPQHQAAGF